MISKPAQRLKRLEQRPGGYPREQAEAKQRDYEPADGFVFEGVFAGAFENWNSESWPVASCACGLP